MKTTFGLVSAVMVATTLVAQTVTNPPVPAPSETPAAAVSSETTSTPSKAAAKKSAAKKRSGKKTVAKKASPELKSVPLVPGPAVVIVSNLNVRGQAKLNSEVVTHLFKDQVVTVLEEITLKHSAPDEPSAWAKIALPSETHVWVSRLFVDANKTVTAKKLNLRSGPGENYSVLGLLARGDQVKELKTKDDWIAIEAPPNAYAFVAAQYLRQQPAETPAPAPPQVATAAPVVTAPPPAAATTAPAAEAPKPLPPPPTETPQPKPAEAPIAAAPNPSVPPVVVAPTSETLPTAAPTAAPAAEQPPSPRIVTREGIVRGTTSIQAPSQFELISPQNKKTINYLHTPSDDLDLRRWKGLRVLVTGQEGLDERWPNTPVLTIEKIEVMDEL